MRQTVIVSALTAVVTVVLSVVVLNQLGAGTVSSASTADISASSSLPSSEGDGQIQGDTDCDGDVDAVDGLGVLVDVAALDALGQQEPCTDVGTVIPAGEGIPGPQGEQGPPGPQGETGPAGPAGIPAVSGWEIVTAQTVTDSTGSKGIEVLCPAGKRVLGGGGDTDLLFNVAINDSHPTDGNDGWVVRATELNASNSIWRIIAFAICANVAE